MKTKNQLDPRMAIIMVVTNSFVAVLSGSVLVSLVSVTLILMMNFCYKTPLISVFKKFKRLWQIVIFAAIMQSVFIRQGQVLVEILGVSLLTTFGFQKGIIILLRLFSIMCGAIIISSYTQGELIEALVRLGFSYEFAYMVMIGIKFLPMLNEEMQDSLTALQLRGIEMEQLKLSQKVKLYSYLLFPVISGTLIRAKDLSESMETRGFRAFKNRTSMVVLTFSLKDFVAGFMFCAIQIGTLWFLG